MFDFHMHSRVSFDSKADPLDMLAAAERAGLREICFTDHMDFDPSGDADLAFRQEAYHQAYDALPESPVTVRLGMEFGMLPDNRAVFLEEANKRPYDFIIGSVHFAGGLDPYYPAYWQGRSQEQAYECYLQSILECLQTHRDFSVLGHLTYPTKASANPSPKPYTMARYGDLAEEILRKLIDLGIGLEVNTSGLRAGNEPLPPLEFVRRYVELGGEILTIGSDAHVPQRVGQYIPQTLAALAKITPWICTFQAGKPQFHRIEL